ncbi:MAG: hypothetical protein IJD57_02245 [Candidatus Gastranaerophilales bacterium]|nr:hypothetical protein [Candidatus Gastranaerophilales bacterium]
MGLSASQARFLQLTARRSNVEYQAQQINQERLMLSEKLSQASNKYNDLTNNRTLTFNYNDGTGVQEVGLSYTNYKNYMNQQMEGIVSTQQQYFLVSSTGNKIVVANEEDMQAMINSESTSDSPLTADDFMIAPDLDDVDNFQRAIREGVYFFATKGKDDEGNMKFNTQDWGTLGGGAINDKLDKADDKAAEAEFNAFQTKIQNSDKKLELKLTQLETERDAIQTEIESISKVVDDNIESSFKVFS